MKVLLTVELEQSNSSSKGRRDDTRRAYSLVDLPIMRLLVSQKGATSLLAGAPRAFLEISTTKIASNGGVVVGHLQTRSCDSSCSRCVGYEVTEVGANTKKSDWNPKQRMYKMSDSFFRHVCKRDTRPSAIQSGWVLTPTIVACELNQPKQNR